MLCAFLCCTRALMHFLILVRAISHAARSVSVICCRCCCSPGPFSDVMHVQNHFLFSFLLSAFRLFSFFRCLFLSCEESK